MNIMKVFSENIQGLMGSQWAHLSWKDAKRKFNLSGITIIQKYRYEQK